MIWEGTHFFSEPNYVINSWDALVKYEKKNMYMFL